jgi:membrane protein implicated in regulation of membrane protease activity
VGTEVVRVVGLTVFAVVVAILAIVLPVLQALLKIRFVSSFIVVAVSALVAIMILLCGIRGSQTRRAESGEGDSKSQHPY